MRFCSVESESTMFNLNSDFFVKKLSLNKKLARISTTCSADFTENEFKQVIEKI